MGIFTTPTDTHVLTSVPVPALALRALSLGATFVPTTPHGAYVKANDAKDRVLDFGRRLAWRVWYSHKGDTTPAPRFKPPTTNPRLNWPAPGPGTPLTSMRSIVRSRAEVVELTVRSFRFTESLYPSNIPLPMRSALLQLKTLQPAVVVRKADKNMGVVLVDRVWYDKLLHALRACDHLPDAARCTLHVATVTFLEGVCWWLQ